MKMEMEMEIEMIADPMAPNGWIVFFSPNSGSKHSLKIADTYVATHEHFNILLVV